MDFETLFWIIGIVLLFEWMKQIAKLMRQRWKFIRDERIGKQMESLPSRIKIMLQMPDKRENHE